MRTNEPLALLFGEDFVLNDRISISSPTLKQICQCGEMNFWSTVSTLCSTPADFKVLLYDAFNVYWTNVSEFEWFAIVCKQIDKKIVSLLFKDLDLSHTGLYQDSECCKVICDSRTKQVLLTEPEYFEMMKYLRKVYGLKKTEIREVSEKTRDYMIKRARRKAELHKNDKEQDSILEPMVSTLANAGVGYTYDTILNMRINQFMDAVGRIQKIKTYDNLMHGAYSGTLDISKVNQNDLNYMGAL